MPTSFKQSSLEDIYSLSLIKDLSRYNLQSNDMILNAMKFAKYYHHGQERKSKEPYYMHPVAVTKKILPYSYKQTVIIGALLHDVVEDTSATLGMILDEFGWRVAEIVDRLTRNRSDGSKWSIREVIENAYKVDDKEVMLIKICDRLHNLETIEFMQEEKQKKIAEETIVEILITAIYLEITNIEEYMLQICAKHLNINTKLLKTLDNHLKHI